MVIWVLEKVPVLFTAKKILWSLTPVCIRSENIFPGIEGIHIVNSVDDDLILPIYLLVVQVSWYNSLIKTNDLVLSGTDFI